MSTERDPRPGAPNASLRVDLFPSGTPGQVLMQVVDLGPVQLTPAEAARTLRAAADSLDGTSGEADGVR